MMTPWIPTNEELSEPIRFSNVLGYIRKMRETLCGEWTPEIKEHLRERYTGQLAPHVLKLGFYLIKVIELEGDLRRVRELRFPEDRDDVV
jgi:hypothetical protein